MHPHIEIHPDICHGKPCIKGTRIMVANILSLLAGGYNHSRIIRNYPELIEEDIRAVLEYAESVILDEEILIPA